MTAGADSAAGEPGGTDREAGFSLLELVAALAIYATVALLATQMLAGGLANRGRAEAARQETAAAVAALSVLRRDLETLAPAALGAPGFEAGDGSLTLRILAATGGPEDVTWRLDAADGTLRRAAGGREAVLLSGAGGWSVRALPAAGDWIAAADWTPAAPGALPAAVDLRLTHAGLGELRVMVTR